MIEVGQEITLPLKPEFKLIITTIKIDTAGLVKFVKAVLIPLDFKILAIDETILKLLNEYVTQFITCQLGYLPESLNILVVYANNIYDISKPPLEFGDFDAFEEVITKIYQQQA